jgi:hypothetical protein
MLGWVESICRILIALRSKRLAGTWVATGDGGTLGSVYRIDGSIWPLARSVAQAALGIGSGASQ